jgi:lipopolysaccharide biosynthesis glycosyltransferase
MRTAIALVTDQPGYELARHAAVSIIMSQKSEYDLYVFCHKFEPPKQDPIFSYAASKAIRLEMLLITDKVSETFLTHGHITTATLLKFEAVDRLAKQYDRILYSDIDILFFKDIGIDTIDFQNKPLAAVVDVGEWLTKIYTIETNGPSPGGEVFNEFESIDYFNAGLLLFNCSMWESERFRTRYVELLTEHDEHCIYKKHCRTIDQCALNRMFEGQWVKLPLGYNLQACAKFTEQWKVAEARHYTGSKKFLPIKFWRNDRRDTLYIREIQRSLGYKVGIYLPFASYIYELNERRHKSNADRIASIMRGIEARMANTRQNQIRM